MTSQMLKLIVVIPVLLAFAALVVAISRRNQRERRAERPKELP